MQKRVQRKEVDVTVNVPVSPVGKEPPVANRRQVDGLGLPSVEAISAKYGVTVESAANQPSSASNNEAVAALSSKVTQYEGIIGTMRQKVEEKNRKIEQLCVLLEALEPVPGVDPSRMQAIVGDNIPSDDIDLRDSKIVALAKKSHRLTMLLNKEKSTTDRLTQDLQESKQRCEALSREVSILRDAAPSQKAEPKSYNRHAMQATAAAAAAAEANDGDSGNSVEQLQRTVKDLNKVVEDQKGKIRSLTDENKGLVRTLQRELGDGVTLEQAVDGGWRGRAQQIVMLKAKVKTMENSLMQLQGHTRTGNDVDAKASDELVEMGRERRQIVEALTEERVQLLDQIQTLEQKNKATKSRVTILENEARKLKDNLVIALDKSGNDDQLVEALRAEVQRLQGRLQSVDSARHTSSRIPQAVTASVGEDEWIAKEKQLSGEVQRLQRLCRSQAEQLDSQDVTIRSLRKKLNPN